MEGTIFDLVAHGILSNGDLLEHTLFSTVLLQGRSRRIYETASCLVRVKEIKQPGWATILSDASTEPSLDDHGIPVSSKARLETGAAAIGPDDKFRIVRACA